MKNNVLSVFSNVFILIFSCYRKIKMGCFVSKDKLTKEDMDFLKTHTSYDETTIKEWYKGFKVRLFFLSIPHNKGAVGKWFYKWRLHTSCSHLFSWGNEHFSANDCNFSNKLRLKTVTTIDHFPITVKIQQWLVSNSRSGDSFIFYCPAKLMKTFF